MRAWESIAKAIDRKGESRLKALREKVGTPQCTKAWEEHWRMAQRAKVLLDKDRK